MNPSEEELAESIDIFVDELLRFRQGENLLVYVDAEGDSQLAHAIQAHAQRRGGRAEVLELSSASPLADQAQQLADKIERGSFQALCELSEQYFYLTSAWSVARRVGARVYSLGGLDAASFIRCVGKVNHRRMFEYGMVLKRMLQKSRRLRVRTENGTDIQMKLGLNRLHRLMHRLMPERREQPRSYIYPPSGFLDGDTHATFLGGQLAFRGIPATIEGTAVIDGYLWPPAEIGSLEEPLILKIAGGRVCDINGCPVKSRILARWFEGQMVHVEHFCIGFNPGARLPGKIVEAERVLGAISVGMGQGFYHTDGVIKNPSMEADGIVIEDNGVFVAKQLMALEKGLVRGEHSPSFSPAALPFR